MPRAAQASSLMRGHQLPHAEELAHAGGVARSLRTPQRIKPTPSLPPSGQRSLLVPKQIRETPPPSRQAPCCAQKCERTHTERRAHPHATCAALLALACTRWRRKQSQARRPRQRSICTRQAIKEENERRKRGRRTRLASQIRNGFLTSEWGAAVSLRLWKAAARALFCTRETSGCGFLLCVPISGGLSRLWHWVAWPCKCPILPPLSLWPIQAAGHESPGMHACVCNMRKERCGATGLVERVVRGAPQGTAKQVWLEHGSRHAGARLPAMQGASQAQPWEASSLGEPLGSSQHGSNRRRVRQPIISGRAEANQPWAHPSSRAPFRRAGAARAALRCSARRQTGTD